MSKALAVKFLQKLIIRGQTIKAEQKAKEESEKQNANPN